MIKIEVGTHLRDLPGINEKNLIDGAKTMRNIDGQNYVADYVVLELLTQEYKPKTIYEVGTNRGHTTLWFARLLPDVKIWTIDVGRVYNILPDPTVIGIEFRDKPEASRIEQLRGDSQDADFVYNHIPHDSVDLCFIDGTHTNEAVFKDSVITYPLMSPIGVMVWHDATGDEMTRGIKDFCCTVGMEFIYVPDTLVGYAKVKGK